MYSTKSDADQVTQGLGMLEHVSRVSPLHRRERRRESERERGNKSRNGNSRKKNSDENRHDSSDSNLVEW